MNKFKINSNEKKEVWDYFVDSSPQRSIFVKSKFLDSLSVDYDLVTCYRDNNIVAGAVLLKDSDGYPVNNPFKFTMYQGVLLAKQNSQSINSRISFEFAVLEFFINQLTSLYNRFCLAHSWRLNDIRPFQWFNYNEPYGEKINIVLRYTGILNLDGYQDFSDYFKSIRSVRRQEFRKASRELKFILSDDVYILKDLYRKTLERQEIELSEKDSKLIESIANATCANSYGKLGLAILNDTPVSAVLFVQDDRSAYYLFGANDPEYRNMFSGTFLLINMINDAYDSGIREIDLVGVNSPNRGDFKLSLNAELKPYFLTSIGCV